MNSKTGYIQRILINSKACNKTGIDFFRGVSLDLSEKIRSLELLLLLVQAKSKAKKNKTFIMRWHNHYPTNDIHHAAPFYLSPQNPGLQPGATVVQALQAWWLVRGM